MVASERLVRAEEDITAISDTVLDIKMTVDTHTETLSEHGRDLTDIRATVGAHTETLSEHGRDLADIKSTLATITSTLGEILTAIRPDE